MKESFHLLLETTCAYCITHKVDFNSLVTSLKAEHLWHYKEKILTEEDDELYNVGISAQRFSKLFNLLSSKTENVFLSLQKVCIEHGWVEMLDLIKNGLIDLGSDDLVWRFSNRERSIIDTQISEQHIKTLNNIVHELKRHYEEHLKNIHAYWEKFGLNGQLNTDTFYCYDIETEVKGKKLENKVNSFEDIFKTGSRRIVIQAGAGYGKSTFVHQMTREWMKGRNELGEKIAWTKQFVFLFLFRLAELTKEDTKSFQSLFENCLTANNTENVIKLLKDKKYLERSLFIFDGLDEKQHDYCESINRILYGTGSKLYNVIITSRQGEKLNELKNKSSSIEMYVELNGFTERGIRRQMEKFSVKLDKTKEIMSNLTVPLYLTFYFITYGKSAQVFNSVCSIVKEFVSFLCSRYRKIVQNFSPADERELILALGKVGQNKFNFVKGVTVDCCLLTTELVETAKKVGLIHRNSNLSQINFVHQIIAEYCAAFFWNTEQIVVKSVDYYDIKLAKPTNGSCHIQDSFTGTLSFLNYSFKSAVWKYFTSEVPLFDDYEDLPDKLLTSEGYNYLALNFSTRHSATNMKQVLEKIYLPPDLKIIHSLCISNAIFESSKFFKKMIYVEQLCLYDCEIKFDIQEIFATIKTKMDIQEELSKNSDGFMELQNNQSILASVTDFSFIWDYSFDCTSLFKVVNEMKNLEKLHIFISRILTTAELEAFLKYFQGFQLKHLQLLKVEISFETPYNSQILVFIEKDAEKNQFIVKDLKFKSDVLTVLSKLINDFQIDQLCFYRCKISNSNAAVLSNLLSSVKPVITKISFEYCSFFISPVQFFQVISIDRLRFIDCKDFNKDMTCETMEYQKLVFNELEFTFAYSFLIYWSYIVKNSSAIRKICLNKRSFDSDDKLNEWINELKNNTALVKSVEEFEIKSYEAIENIFSVLSQMTNLKVLAFCNRYPTESEITGFKNVIKNCQNLEKVTVVGDKFKNLLLAFSFKECGNFFVKV